MSEGEFHAYVGLLTISAVILSVLAARGFGQPAWARIVDGLFAAGFLGYAAYLVIADPDTVRVFFYAFAVPVLGVIQAVRSARETRTRHIPISYAAEPAPVPPQPFPAPPGPRAADPATEGAKVDDVPSPYTYQAMPSGLRDQAPVTGPAAAPPPSFGPRPSGLAEAPAFSLEESGRSYKPRPSGLPASAASPPSGPSSAAAPRDDVQLPSRTAEPYAPFRLGPDQFVEPRRDHSEAAATAAYPYQPMHSWHEPRHAAPSENEDGVEDGGTGRHRMPETDRQPPADWPPRRR